MQFRIIKRILISAIFIMLLSVRQLSAGTDKVLTITHARDYAPFSFIGRDGEPSGLLIDIWKLWAIRNDVKVRFILTDWKDTIKMVAEGKADIHAGLFPSDERLRIVDFIHPVIQVDTAIFTDSSTRVSSINDLGDIPVGVMKGDYAEGYLETRYPYLKRAVYQNNTELFAAVNSGHIHALISDEPQVVYYLYRNNTAGSFKILEELYSLTLTAAVKKGDKELGVLVGEGFRKIKRREIREIEERWILYSRQDLREKVIRWIGISIAVISVIVFIANYFFLRRKVRKKTAALETELEFRRMIEKQLLDMATHDSLTELPNRKLFSERLNHAIAGARRQRCQLAVIFLDLDGFKHVNDTFGHDCGDELLKGVAGRLRDCVREADTVARLGGDEFTIILEMVKNKDEVTTVAERMLKYLSMPYSFNKGDAVVTASLGISLYPEDGETYDELVRSADNAMYRAKEYGKNRYSYSGENV